MQTCELKGEREREESEREERERERRERERGRQLKKTLSNEGIFMN